MNLCASRRGRLLAATALSGAMLVSATSGWAQSQRPDPDRATHAAATKSTVPLRKAPKEFREQLIEAFRSLSAEAPAAIRGSAGAAFEQQVEALNRRDLDLLYSAGPEIWEQIRQTVATTPNAPRASAAAFRASSMSDADDPPPDPVLGSCKPGAELAAQRHAATALQIAADAIAAIIAIFNEQITIFGVSIPNPLYTIPFTIKSAIEASAASINLDADLQGWCAGADEYNLDYYLSHEAPHSLFAFDKKLLEGFGPLLKQLEAAKKQLQDRGTITQQKLAAATTEVSQIETKSDDSLHTMIESALNGQSFSELMVRPARSGGYLDSAPVGVRQIVTDALAAMRATEQPVSSAGPRHLALADQALYEGRYKNAFHLYQLAYRAIATY